MERKRKMQRPGAKGSNKHFCVRSSSQGPTFRSSQQQLSYPIFMPKPCTDRMHDSGSIVPHLWPKVITDNQMSWIKYNYYINNVSKDYDDSQ
jgi:hypothetical protein